MLKALALHWSTNYPFCFSLSECQLSVRPTITLPAYTHRHAHSVYDAPLAHRVVLSLLVLKLV